jgi:Mg-chelatase subunit ChlD
VEAATPVIKEVVVVIDRSYSMRKPDNSPLMNIAKDAAITVLDSLASHDLVGVVGFSNEIETLPGCFSESMAMASQHNVKQLQKFVRSLKPSGGTYYVKALQKAFALLESAKNMSTSAGEHGNRGKPTLDLYTGYSL